MSSIILIAAVALVALWAIWIFNRLIRDRNRTEAGWSDIDVQLQRRHDLIGELFDELLVTRLDDDLADAGLLATPLPAPTRSSAGCGRG